MLLGESSGELLTINTYLGLFKPSSVAGIFQRGTERN